MNSGQVMDGISPLSSEALERLVFILGTSRGGTTIVRRAVCEHEEILGMDDTNFM